MWQKALELIRTQVSEENFLEFFQPLRFCDVNDERVLLEAENGYYADWIRTFHLAIPTAAVEEAFGRPLRVEIVARDAQMAEAHTGETCAPVEIKPEPSVLSEGGEEVLRSFPLNPNYTFRRFVVGPNNEMAHAASEAVARNPAQAFNPLFIYGGTGLGKTHLLHAIAHSILERKPSARILYISAEEFINQMIDSIKYQRMEAFRAHYRTHCDVLLMDDVHVLQGKDRTQEEFFNTFNALHSAQKQIVLTSDRSPAEIKHLEDRLKSRFHWGMLADVKAPQFETRVAILQERAESEGVELPDDVAFLIARRICANVRELEGALTRLMVGASVKHCPLSVPLAEEILSELMESHARSITIESIQKLVSEYYDVRVDDICGPKRPQVIAHPRSVAMYLCRKHTQAPFPVIGREFGGKNHTSVMTWVRKSEKEIAEGGAVKSEIDVLERKLAN